MASILKYSEYLVKQALWLQRKNDERKNYGTNKDQFFLQSYIEYLDIINSSDQLKAYVRGYISKLNPSITLGPNPNYSSEVSKNIVNIIDHIVTKFNTEKP